MRTYTESAGGHLSGYVNMSGITGKENSGWIPDRRSYMKILLILSLLQRQMILLMSKRNIGRRKEPRTL